MHRSRLRRLVTLAGLTGLFMLPGLGAQELDHAPLATDPTLNFSTLLEQTLRHAPNALEGPAREAEARAMNALGASWIAGRPSVQLDAIDDRLLNNLGQRELTWGVNVPLWRPGERRAMQARGAQYEAQYAAWEDAFTLDLAGQLRKALADMAEADAVLAAEQLATADARELVRIAELRFAAGDIAERELLQARALLLSQQRNELTAEAGRVDAERLYATLTGLQVRPASLPPESAATQDTVPDSHPLLRLLSATVAVADAEVDKAEADARGAPTLAVGTRRQRAGLFADYEDALAVSLNIPLGGRAHVNAATSAQRRSKVDAEVRHATARRALDLQLHEVEHALFVLTESIALSEQQAQLARQQWEMARAAFEAGETDISQVVIALQQTRLSARELETNTLYRARLTAEFNQILGVLP